VFAEAAKELKGEILFVVSGVKEGIQQRLSEFIGVTEAQLPAVTLFHPGDNMKKFQFPSAVKSITLDALKSFIGDFKSNKLEAFLKSEDVPAENNEPVKIVVGKNFKEIVLDDEKDVLMEFYAPWCGHCKKLAPIWDQVAADFKDIPNLVLAKMDSTANEVEGVEVSGYPTLKFYPRGAKSAPVDFDGGREVEDIKNWLKEKSEAYKQWA
jgi:protein disulfide-isomerase A1